MPLAQPLRRLQASADGAHGGGVRAVAASAEFALPTAAAVGGCGPSTSEGLLCNADEHLRSRMHATREAHDAQAPQPARSPILRENVRRGQGHTGNQRRGGLTPVHPCPGAAGACMPPAEELSECVPQRPLPAADARGCAA
eukprot:scaffold7141_cov242-Prasinococcus_capsulatus_cf.AAC.1